MSYTSKNWNEIYSLAKACIRAKKPTKKPTGMGVRILKLCMVGWDCYTREYVQRVGRVIRQAPNKEESVIYDLIVKPSYNAPGVSNILFKEAKRAEYIAQNAINFDEVKKIFLENGVELNADQ